MSAVAPGQERAVAPAPDRRELLSIPLSQCRTSRERANACRLYEERDRRDKSRHYHESFQSISVRERAH